MDEAEIREALTDRERQQVLACFERIFTLPIDRLEEPSSDFSLLEKEMLAVRSRKKGGQLGLVLFRESLAERGILSRHPNDLERMTYQRLIKSEPEEMSYEEMIWIREVLFGGLAGGKFSPLSLLRLLGRPGPQKPNEKESLFKRLRFGKREPSRAVTIKVLEELHWKLQCRIGTFRRQHDLPRLGPVEAKEIVFSS
ncbi:MAG TPA: hypothetical protein VMW41_06755 [Candidatus Bathyarchaeia archaeon]|nr:hypothetical protein [Candidatus Bathyarchaeia archaeon]